MGVFDEPDSAFFPSNNDSAFSRNLQYTLPGNHVFNTPLTTRDETAFREWVNKNNIPFNQEAPTTDYDMRGFWSALQRGDTRAVSAIDPHDNRLHYPDYWKTPLHETFSAESQWATPNAPRWTPDGRLVDNAGNIVYAPFSLSGGR